MAHFLEIYNGNDKREFFRIIKTSESYIETEWDVVTRCSWLN